MSPFFIYSYLFHSKYICNYISVLPLIHLHQNIKEKIAKMSSLIGKLETDMELNASAGRFMICSATGLPKFPRLLMIRYEHVLYMKVNGGKEGFIISWNYDHGKFEFEGKFFLSFGFIYKL